MSEDSLLEFPCRFPVKVMGRDTAAFREAAFATVLQHVGDLSDDDVQSRSSRDGTFVAVTFMIEAQSREQLDGLYQALSDI